ncbi:MAG: TIGR02584 family CRISPR-associated protein [Deltaproteobacteria bacterium]|nr:MAG: TIGR02584 family CRISPR-associated protein [Deltaproteobacteria bacterium]
MDPRGQGHKLRSGALRDREQMTQGKARKSHFKEVFVFVVGKTPQVVTETIYGLLQKEPPILPDEIHILTTEEGKREIEKGLISKGNLRKVFEEYGFRPLAGEKVHVTVIPGTDGSPLRDIRTEEENEAVGDFITDFIRRLAENPEVRLHCSLAGGRKTMGFYLGAALTLFGRPWDRLYHVLVSPEFESHPDFYFKPKKDRLLKLGDRELPTSEAEIFLAELPFLRLREKISLGEKPFRELVKEGQREVELALFQKEVVLDLEKLTLAIGGVTVKLTPMQLILYRLFLLQKVQCPEPHRDHCGACTACFLAIPQLSSRKTFDDIYRALVSIYGEGSGSVEAFRLRWEPKGGVAQEVFRQRIAKINRSLKEHLGEDASLYLISPVGRYGTKRYGVRVDKKKITLS